MAINHQFYLNELGGEPQKSPGSYADLAEFSVKFWCSQREFGFEAASVSLVWSSQREFGFGAASVSLVLEQPL